MAKWSNDAALDLLLGYYDDCDRIAVCHGQPASYAEMTTNEGGGGHKLAISTTPTFQVIGNGGGGGRDLEVDAEANMTVDVTGDADHVALGRSADSSLRAVTTCTLQGLTAGNTVSTPHWHITVGDPT